MHALFTKRNKDQTWLRKWILLCKGFRLYRYQLFLYPFKNHEYHAQYNSVPKDESISKCEFITFIPHKSDTDTVSNIINDYYQFEKYRRSYSFIIFHYSGDYQPNFEIEVEGLNDLNDEKTGNEEKTENNESNATTIILIVLCGVLACALIIAITFLVILARRSKIGPNAEEAHNAIPNQDYPLND